MKHIIAFLLSAITFYCYSQDFYVEFSSFGDCDLKGKSFFIKSGIEGIDDSDLEFQYYADIIKQLLIRKKAIPTNDFITADFCIFLDYSIKDVSYDKSKKSPIWGKTGIQSVTTTSTTNSSVSANANADAYSYGNSDNANVNTTAEGSSTTKTTQDYTYNYGVKGYENVSIRVTEFLRSLNLFIYDNKTKEGTPKMLCKINAESSGHSNDLSHVFPFMAEAISEFIGKKSNGKQETIISEEDADALAMKSGVYLELENSFLNPTNYDKTGIEGVVLRCVEFENNTTVLNFMCQKKATGSLKFSKNTYIKYNGQKYYVQKVSTVKNDNMLDKKIKLSDTEKRIVSLVFPILMNKGDIFDFVAYKDKKEKESLFSIFNIVLE